MQNQQNFTMSRIQDAFGIDFFLPTTATATVYQKHFP